MTDEVSEQKLQHFTGHAEAANVLIVSDAVLSLSDTNIIKDAWSCASAFVWQHHSRARIIFE
jgi:hypothetical protein